MAKFTMLIKPDELAGIIDDARCRVLDCRFDLAAPEAGHENYLAGHVPGAVYAHLDRDLSGPVTPECGRHPLPTSRIFASTLGRLGVGNDNQVVVYDANNGALAARAWWMLRWVGHDAVAVLDGGLAAWKAAGNPLASGETVPVATSFSGREERGRVLSTADVVAALDEPLLLVDARDAARFRGDAEPIDPVAGHIPGALNFPLGDSLGPDGRWKSPLALANAWSRVLGDAPGGPWAVMCGSGVTACHLALSARLAGYQEPRLYAGSWSEWIRDPACPVATGARRPDAEPTST